MALITAIPKPIRHRDPKYLAWIRIQRCSAHSHSLDCGDIEAHHVRADGHGGIGTKPDDSRAIPLCVFGHRLYHDHGRDWFEHYYSIELETEIKRLNALYLREHPQVTQRVPRETNQVHLKHCAKCSEHVTLCKKAKRRKARI